MQILKGKAWEIWLHVMTLGRQRVDIRERCLTGIILISHRPIPGIITANSIDAALQMLLASSLQQETALRFFIPPPPLSSVLSNMTKSLRPFPLCLRTAHGQRLEVGTAWE